jgi:hypothetical protein
LTLLRRGVTRDMLKTGSNTVDKLPELGDAVAYIAGVEIGGLVGG